jgi:tetratricopeptide (TPR) repeat protein
MNDLTRDSDIIDFGELSPAVNELLQKGVAAYRRDPELADRLFRDALALSPDELPAYYCLYKIHTYMGNLEVAFEMANLGLEAATRQAGWSIDPSSWPIKETAPGSAERFALYTLKALSFIELKRGHKPEAMENLAILEALDPRGDVGWTVIYELAQGVA